MRSITGTWMLVAWSVVATSAAGQSTQPATAPAIDVSVDPRVELICTIFNLAGHPEYNQPMVRSYADDVSKQFGGFSDHEVVQLVRRLRATRGVSFDAPMSLAVHLRDAKLLDGLVPLDPLPENVDNRWRPDDIREFQRLAKVFAEKSRFAEFFDAHRDLYDRSAQRLRRMIDQNVRLEWFDRFFGAKPQVRFHIIIGLQNGPSNYGSRTVIDGREDLYCILGVWLIDSQGIPEFPVSIVPTVVHEFCHSYANPLVDRHYDVLEAAGDALYRSKESQMRGQAYGNGRTVLYESLVRACVTRYRYAKDGARAGVTDVLAQQARGFVWMGGLSALLEQYENQRETYPTLESFMPQVVKFFDEYAADVAAKP